MTYTQASIYAVSLTFPILGLILVGVRFWMRWKLQKTSLWLDDWTILFAGILVVGMGANFIVGSYLGTMGMDGQPTIESRKPTQSKIDYAMLVFEKPAYGAIKLSVLLFYRRIFIVKEKFCVINNWLIALIVAWTFTFWLVDILNCGAHPEANWDPVVKETTHCVNLFVFLLVFAITDVLTDIAIMWMPYPQIKKLHMDTKERWAISGVFLLGTIDLLIGIIRMGFVIANQTIPAVNTNFNPPESTAPTFWTVVEVGVGVIAANLPALAPLFRHRAKLASSLSSSFRGRLWTRSSNKSASRNDSTFFSQKEQNYSSSDGEVRVGSVRAMKGHRTESVGAWDHFERAEHLSAEELDRTGGYVREPDVARLV